MFAALINSVYLGSLVLAWFGGITTLRKAQPGLVDVAFSAVLELLLLVQSVLAGVGMASGHHLVEPATFIGYLIGVVVILPVCVAWTIAERSRWNGAVLSVAAFTVAVMTLRLPRCGVRPMPDLTDTGPEAPVATSSGLGRVLIAIYGIFRACRLFAGWSAIGHEIHEAPVAHLLSAFSGLVYVAATVFLARKGAVAHRWAVVACSIELVGVLGIGVLSLIRPDWFPAATVWSRFGSGMATYRLVLPMIGLWWLRRTALRS